MQGVSIQLRSVINYKFLVINFLRFMPCCNQKDTGTVIKQTMDEEKKIQLQSLSNLIFMFLSKVYVEKHWYIFV